MIGLTGGDSSAAGIGLAEVPAIDVAHEAVVDSLARIVLHHGEKVADAIVGQPGLVAGVRQQADRVVDVDRRSPAVGHGVDVLGATRGVRGGDLELDVVLEAFDSGPARLGFREAESRQHAGNLRQVAHEDRGQLDDVGPAGARRHDGQAEQDTIGIGEIDGLFLGAPLGGREADVLANDVNAVVDFAELPNPIVAETPAHAP